MLITISFFKGFIFVHSQCVCSAQACALVSADTVRTQKMSEHLECKVIGKIASHPMLALETKLRSPARGLLTSEPSLQPHASHS